jgi:hypothetical protein
LLNTKVKAHHFGIEGNIKSITYRSFFSFSNNYGTNSDPFEPVKKTVSVLIDLNTPVKLYYNMKLNVKIGMDIGKMYGNNFGFIISLTKRGAFIKN